MTEISVTLSARELIRWVIFLEKKGSMIYHHNKTKKQTELAFKVQAARRKRRVYPSKVNYCGFERGDELVVLHVKVEDVVDEPLL